MNKFAKEFMLLIFVALPYLYLVAIWANLPDQAPTHFDVNGNPDDWSSKTFFLWFPLAMGLGNYLLMLILPSLDPKKKLSQMGNAYFSIRVSMSVFICGLILYIMHSSSIGRIQSPNFIFFLIGSMIALVGNYFQTIRHNYFIGIRTPWTLENEQVWKETHVFGGRLWIISGVLMIILSILKLSQNILLNGFVLIAIIITLIPVVYSYLRFKKIDHSPGL